MLEGLTGRLAGTVTTAVDGAAPADAAWARYAAPSRWPSWSPQLRAVDVDGPDRLRPGLRGRVRGRLPPALPFEVTAVDEVARTWSWTVHLGPVPLHLEHGVEPLTDRLTTPHGCRATLRMTGPWPLVLGYLPLARLALGRLVRP